MKQLSLVILSLVSFSCIAGDGFLGDPTAVFANCTDVRCTQCEPVCSPRRVKKEEKKHCWKVLPKYVCIPGYKLPWQSCGTPRCGRVRCINVLEKHEYKCEKCGYEWEVKMVRTGKKQCCNRRSNCCPDCGTSSGCTEQKPNKPH